MSTDEPVPGNEEEPQGDDSQEDIIEVGSLPTIHTAPVDAQSGAGSNGDGGSNGEGDAGEDDRNLVGGPTQIQLLPFDPSKHREYLRGGLAISLVFILAITVVMSFLMIWPTRNIIPAQVNGSQQIVTQQQTDQALSVQDQRGKEGQPTQGNTAPQSSLQGTVAVPESPLENLLTLIFTPLIGLVGAVTGFYFGGESARSRAGK